MRKEVVALQIMKANYEQLVKAHQQGAMRGADLKDGDGDTAVPSDVKFEVIPSLELRNIFQLLTSNTSFQLLTPFISIVWFCTWNSNLLVYCFFICHDKTIYLYPLCIIRHGEFK